MSHAGRNHGRRPVAAARHALSIGLFIPVSGAAGIWGPSCRACAELAADEINARGGLSGREIALTIIEAGDAPDTVAQRAALLIENGDIDAIVGMHTSDVRTALARETADRIPYIYTPLYEGGETTPGVHCIGEQPAQQLLPAVDWLSARYRLKRWFLIGNDYVWPRRTHRLMKGHLALRDHTIAGESYVPFGTCAFDAHLEAIRESRCDAVLVSLVGEDSVRFNRAFGRAGLDRTVLRFSCAVEENVLLGIGAENTDGLFASSGYFGTLSNARHMTFKERYHSRFGERGPTLNTIGQSLYEGMYFLDALLGRGRRHGRDGSLAPAGARRMRYRPGRGAETEIFLARAEGHEFEIVKAFAPG